MTRSTLRPLGWALGFWMLGTAAWAAPVARVNGDVITDDDVSAVLSGYSEAQKHNILKEKAAKAQVVESLIDQEILFQAAKKDGLEKSPEYAAGLRAFQKQFLANLLMSKKVGARLTEAEAKKYYEKNAFRFTTGQVHLWQILLNTEAEARDIAAKVRGGADFQKLAEQVSKDPNAKSNRGDAGMLTRDQLPPEIGDAVYVAKKGDIVGPIQSSVGFHVIKVVERTAGRQLGYDEVALQVKGGLQQDLMREILLQYKKSAKIDRL